MLTWALGRHPVGVEKVQTWYSGKEIDRKPRFEIICRYQTRIENNIATFWNISGSKIQDHVKNKNRFFWFFK